VSGQLKPEELEDNRVFSKTNVITRVTVHYIPNDIQLDYPYDEDITRSRNSLEQLSSCAST